MKNLQVKSSIFLLVLASALAWTILAWFSDINLAVASSFFSLIPKVVTIDLVLILLFTKFGWKWKLLSGWLVPFPNLHGSWAGSIHSDWVNPETGEGVPPIPVVLCINQSFFQISCKMMTGEMESFSTSEGFNIDKERQVRRLAYIYSSRPRIVLNQRSLPHDGAIVFDIVQRPSRKLVGRYWTERKTTGEIILERYCDELLEALPKELRQHPVTEAVNRR